jgi:hypothetical protein
MPAQYRKKPIVVEAIQWTGGNVDEIQGWGAQFFALDLEDRENADDPDSTAELFVVANYVWIGVVPGEWIIKDSKGYYPCKSDVFEATYEAV